MLETAEAKNHTSEKKQKKISIKMKKHTQEEILEHLISIHQKELDYYLFGSLKNCIHTEQEKIDEIIQLRRDKISHLKQELNKIKQI